MISLLVVRRKPARLPSPFARRKSLDAGEDASIDEILLRRIALVREQLDKREDRMNTN